MLRTQVSPEESAESTGRPPFSAFLAALGSATMRIFRTRLRPIALSPRQQRALEMLAPAAMTQQALGESLAADPAQVVGLLNELEEAGLVRRTRDPSDRRRHIVEIVDAGRTRLATAAAEIARIDETLLAGLDAAERENLASLLMRVAKNAGFGEPCEAVEACARAEAACDEGGECREV